MGGHLSGLATKATTSNIPIVFNAGEDPVTLSLVSSINRPGGNATGVYVFLVEMDAKRMELLRELVPNPALIAVLLNPKRCRRKSRGGTRGRSTHRARRGSNEREIHAHLNE